MRGRSLLALTAAVLVLLAVATAGQAQGPVSEFDTILAERVVATDSMNAPDLTLADDLVVNGDASVTGAITGGTAAITGAVTGASFSGAMAATKLNVVEGGDITVTAGSTITPTASLHFLTAAGVVTAGGLADGTNGQVVVLINSGANAITINDASNVRLSGNIALGQYDTLTLLYRNPNWYQLATSNN